MISALTGFTTVLALAVLIGDRWVRIVAPRVESRLRVATVVLAGLVALGLLGQFLTALSIPWNRATLLAASLALVAMLWRAAARADLSSTAPAGAAPSLLPRVLSWAPVAVFAWASWSLRSPYSDFVYHWGVKAKRYFLAGGLDYGFLTAAERGYMNPDYPHLLPELFAFSAIFGGRFEERGLLLWSPLWLALLVAVVWRGLQPLRDRWLATMGWIAISTAISAFAIGYYLGGSPDPGIALAAILGALLLEERRPIEGAGALGIAAAFAAGLKLEGAVLAAGIVVFALWQGRKEWRHHLGHLAALTLPPALVVAVWLIPVWQLDLWQAGHRAGFQLVRWPEIAHAMVAASRVEAWRGLPLLLLGAPLLFAGKRTRWLGAIASLELAFALSVYFAKPGEVEFLVLASFPRLALHALPLVLVGLLRLADSWIPCREPV